MRNKMPYLKLWLVMIGLFAGAQISAQTGLTDSNKRTTPVFEAMYKSLLEKPKWLFGEDICPFEVFPKVENEKFYPFESCAENADICLEKCKENDGAACYSLAVAIQMKKGAEQDISEYLFLRACKLGVISGCTNRAARILNDNPNDAKLVKCAADTFEKSCEKDDPWGCTMFGFILHQGITRPQDDERALQVLSKSCKYGEDDPACVRAKELIEEIKKSKREKSK
jgi:TPR repeat protein